MSGMSKAKPNQAPPNHLKNTACNCGSIFLSVVLLMLLAYYFNLLH